MSVNNKKIQCPECRKIYTINKSQLDLAGKKTARCVACDKRFIVELHGEIYANPAGEITFLKSYFEKRNGSQRRKPSDRRQIDQAGYIASRNLPIDVIPILNAKGDDIIGHISPGRRQGSDRRSGFDRRHFFSLQP
jgi:predicted Zn finger-like uncharacterized protein